MHSIARLEGRELALKVLQRNLRGHKGQRTIQHSKQSNRKAKESSRFEALRETETSAAMADDVSVFVRHFTPAACGKICAPSCRVHSQQRRASFWN